MDVVTIEGKQFTVAAIGENVSGKTLSPVMEYLASEKVKVTSLADAFRPIFQMYAERGRNGVTAKMFHEASKEDGIWQFSKGNHRIFCFKDDDKKQLILLSHGARKTTRKADKSEVERAVRTRDLYLERKRAGQIRYRTLKEVIEEQGND